MHFIILKRCSVQPVEFNGNNFFVSINKIYFNITFVNHTECTKFINCLHKQYFKCENITVITTKHKTDRPPNLRLQASVKLGFRHISNLYAVFEFLATGVAIVRTEFQFVSHHTNGATVQSRMTDIGYDFLAIIDKSFDSRLVCKSVKHQPPIAYSLISCSNIVNNSLSEHLVTLRNQ
jgi:hypothetical protein